VDDSTVDLISALARRRTPAKLMLLATCRPLEPAGHSFKGLIPDLLLHRLGREIALTPLSEAEVEEYLATQSAAARSPAARSPPSRPPPGLSALVHRHSQGNPLFMVAALEHMAKRSLLTRVGGRWQLHRPLEQIEKRAGTESLPDGSITERYEFVHALYRQVLYDRQLPGRRARLHRQIGERLAALYAQRMEEVVPELAYHFEQAADWLRAIDYLQQAAQIAGRRYAHRQADAILARALELMTHLSGAQRARAEPQLLEALAGPHPAALGMRA